MKDLSICRYCIHNDVCALEGLINDYTCKSFRTKSRVNMTFNWSDYQDIIKTLNEVRTRVSKIRKSDNRDSALLFLDELESKLTR